MPWTDERVDELRRLWVEGLSAEEIAGRLGGVTRNSVIGKVHRLGLTGRSEDRPSLRERLEKLMAMTKAEKAKQDELQQRLAALKAIAALDDPLPQPMTYDEIKAALKPGGKTHYGASSKVARGWFANHHTMEVTRGCSDGGYHSTEGDVTTSQQMGEMYRTEAEAWLVVRHRTALEAVATLAKVQAAIDGAKTP